jgi:beta-phosphoglucomutase-like phosphatase (HAD superfamily)
LNQVLTAISKLAVLVKADPAECLAIEDAPNGVRSARVAGMQVIRVTTSCGLSALAEADLIVDSLSVLPHYFAGLLGRNLGRN